ncbi:hypothetical protein [Gimesia fumaroli]|uniref:Uncharacterized protein n=1 Tax=Gimesia fumaroli TaxID=2527976 RepID=A0A518I912_9PLAN|nr:hypothetical protein [Gimesia fumaroli]QDV49603.1 hypothetical protein Enr17x_16230 [Gimesia fumaroli]
MEQVLLSDITNCEYESLKRFRGQVLHDVTEPDASRPGDNPAIIEFKDPEIILTREEQQAFLKSVIQHRVKGDNYHSYDAAADMVLDRIVDVFCQHCGVQDSGEDDGESTSQKYASIGREAGFTSDKPEGGDNA